MQPAVLVAGILGLSLILAVTIYAVARLRIEQYRTMQKFLDRGIANEDLARSAGLGDRTSRDLRRGLLLIAIGFAWSTVTFVLEGSQGPAWVFGLFPVSIGSVYVLFRTLDGRQR
jgi:hypothetical protein